MKKFILLALWCCAFVSCKKSNNGSTVTTTTGPMPDSAQYGTPFTGVPDLKDVVMYEINIRAFSAADNFTGIEPRLDSIRALGVNVIWLMPIYPVGILKAGNSPYCVRNDTAVNSEFGTLTDLRNFVSLAHSKGMAVILDWVTDGTSWDNVWITNTSWYILNSAGVIQANPSYADNAQLNYTNMDMRAAQIHGMEYWILKANVDGFRCDNADPEPDDFWTSAISGVNSLGHKLVLLAESNKTSHFTSGFQMNYGWTYFSALQNVFGSGASATILVTANSEDNKGTVAGRNYMLRFTSNHDIDRNPGTPLALFGGLNGSVAAFVLTATMGGVPLIYNGQEVGCPTQLTIFNTSTLINWSANTNISGAYEQIIAFRNANDAVKEGGINDLSTDNVCCFEKMIAGDTVLVVVNVRNTAQNYTLDASISNTSWNDGSNSNASITLNNTIPLAPYQYILLKKQ